MSPLLEQIVQHLELLPEQALGQILELVTAWSESSKVSSFLVDLDSQMQADDVNYPNLRKDGEMWTVKSSGATEVSWNTQVGEIRDERLESLMKW